MPRHISQGRGLSSVPCGTLDDAQLFGQSRTLRITQLLGFDGSMVNLDPLPAPLLSNPNDFHFFSRASRPSLTQLRIPSLPPSQIKRIFASFYNLHVHHGLRVRDGSFLAQRPCEPQRFPLTRRHLRLAVLSRIACSATSEPSNTFSPLTRPR